MIYWVVGSNIATFMLAWMVCRVVTRHGILEELAQREAQLRNTEAWAKLIEKLGGEK